MHEIKHCNIEHETLEFNNITLTVFRNTINIYFYIFFTHIYLITVIKNYVYNYIEWCIILFIKLSHKLKIV